MKPKEKAKELVEKYDNVTALNLTCDIQTTKKEIHNHAKKCAFIAIEELLNTFVIGDNEILFWLEVKWEIEAL